MMTNRLLYGCVGLACRIVYFCAKKIIVLSPGFKRLLLKHGVPESKVTIIYNWADERHIRTLPYNPDLADQMDFSGKFNVVYAGTLGKAQHLVTVLDAAAIIRDRHPNIRFVFIGAGVDEQSLKNYAAENNLTNVVFEPRRPVAEIQEILAIADVLLLHLKDDPLFEVTVPSKTQANLCAGRPNLAVCRGDACRLFEEANAGLISPPGDAREMAEKIVELYRMSPEERRRMGENGSRYYRKNLSLAKGVEKTLAILEQLVTSKDGSS
jgi:glycosyltransferase involved in cell wall biosynthesis